MSNLTFNGMSAGGISYKSNNYTGKDSEPKGNYGRGPTTAGQTGHQAGPSTAKGGKINGGTTVKCPPNYDKIQMRQSANNKGNERT